MQKTLILCIFVMPNFYAMVQPPQPTYLNHLPGDVLRKTMHYRIGESLRESFSNFKQMYELCPETQANTKTAKWFLLALEDKHGLSHGEIESFLERQQPFLKADLEDIPVFQTDEIKTWFASQKEYITGKRDREKRLRDAALHLDEQSVRRIIAEGVNINGCDGFGHTALTQVFHKVYSRIIEPSVESKITAVVLLLMQTGADVNVQPDPGKTPLCLAASYGYADLVEILLKNGANPNPPRINMEDGDLSSTPLLSVGCVINRGGIYEMRVRKDRYKKTVELLLAAGANPHARSTQGFIIKDFIRAYWSNNDDPLFTPAEKAEWLALIESYEQSVSVKTNNANNCEGMMC